MKLIACAECHAQYDIAGMAPESTFDCRCGASLLATALKGEDAPVQRCSACGALAREEDEHCAYCESAIVHVGRQGSLICPECFARNADDARFCLACGVGFDPEPIQARKTELRCPCCDRWMMSRIVGGIDIQECEKCHGLWAPGDRFADLIDRATRLAQELSVEGERSMPRVDGGNPSQGGVQYRRCPECSALMGRRNFRKRSGVIIDQCRPHGTWLDAHELERIAGFVFSGRAAKAARVLAEEERDRDRAAARTASQHVSMGVDPTGSSHPFFSGDRSRSFGGTILDLLQTILAR